jgi:glucose-1-phosphate adenylyltransferase
MNNTVALVLAGGRIGQYGVLTQNRAKGALTFAGHFRVIDFALSCLRRAQIEQIGIIIQYLPSSLIEHVGVGIPWDLNGYGRSLKIMPPFVGVEKTEWYKGTADALYQNLNFLDDSNPEDVIVMSGEHVVDVDFQDALHAHHDQKADVTFIVKEMPADRCSSRFGYVTTDDADRIERFVEKPATIPSQLVSTGIYIFKAAVLRKLLQQQAGGPDQNLAKDILEKKVSSGFSVGRSSPIWISAEWVLPPRQKSAMAQQSLRPSSAPAAT